MHAVQIMMLAKKLIGHHFKLQQRTTFEKHIQIGLLMAGIVMVQD
jgi:hypothetical protein